MNTQNILTNDLETPSNQPEITCLEELTFTKSTSYPISIE